LFKVSIPLKTSDGQIKLVKSCVYYVVGRRIVGRHAFLDITNSLVGI